MTDSEKAYAMDYRKVYDALVAKAIRKGRTQQEVDELVTWLTGYKNPSALPEGLTYGDFFRNAPAMNPARVAVKGKVCGEQVETLQDPLMRDIRCLDKLVDDLAGGKEVASTCHDLIHRLAGDFLVDDELLSQGGSCRRLRFPWSICNP